jgi:hypothetical protein
MHTKKMETGKEIMTLELKKGRVNLALRKGHNFCHAKRNRRNLKRSQETELQETREDFIFVFFAFLSVARFQSKKGKGFLSSHHCLWNSPWSRVLKQYPLGALSCLRLPKHRGYTKQDKKFQRNTNSVIKIDYTIIWEPYGFPRLRQVDYAKC